MNSKVFWTDQVPDRDGLKNPINDVALSPDGTRLAVGVGNRVLLYNAETGDLIESLRGHKDTVYSVDFSSDGSRFASGGADNVVVIWKISGQGLLKYNHSAPIQRLKYNPNAMQLISCSDSDFGLWTPEQKQVQKEKVAAKILAVAWSTDGTAFAIGMQNGTISIRNHGDGAETHRVDRRAPVWCLAFVPNFAPVITKSSGASASQAAPQGVENDILIVGCWDKTMSFYKVAGSNIRHQGDRPLRYYPTSMAIAGSNTNKSNYLVVSGSNKKATLYSRDGMRLAEIASKESWVWAAASHSASDRVVVGSDNGAIDAIQITFEAVHSLYRDRYAYRENLTEIIVHNLVTDKKVRIKCKDLVQRLSMYKNKLAVQLTDRVCIYESNAEESMDMHFRLRRERISIGGPDAKDKDKLREQTVMAVTSQHLLFCRQDIVELYGFDGQRQRVWHLESPARFMNVDGGPEGRESLILGLQNGSVIKLYVDNPFPIELTKRNGPVIGADLSLYRTKLASVDASNTLVVTDLRTQETIFTVPGVKSVSFNTEVDDMLCYSSDTSMFVVSGVALTPGRKDGSSKDGGSGRPPADPQEQHMAGYAIGFQGQKIYCLYRGSINGVDVPQSTNMQRALDNGEVSSAYDIACLGATEADWKQLAMKALRSNVLHIAKNAFSRLKDIKYLGLIETIERGTVTSASLAAASSSVPGGGVDSGIGGDRRGRQRGAGGAAPAPLSAPAVAYQQTLDPVWQAELLAYEGHHHEAAKMYARNGKVDEAIRLFTDLRRWEDAKLFAQNAGHADISGLTAQQAKWLQETNDWKGAAELYVSMKQYMQAAKIVVDASETGWQSVLIDVVRACPVEQPEVLHFCGEAFAKVDEDIYARETYIKVGEVSKLMSLYARKQMWAEAAKLADEHVGEFDVSVFLPYAEWLVSQDRYEEAMSAYKKAGRKDLCRKVIEELTYNAVSESRFKDAAYYYWLLSKEADNDMQEAEAEHKADLYFAYSSVHAYVTDPFTSHQPEMLFQVARFIINSLGSSEVIPFGISKAATLYTLARQAMILGAFKLARHAYDRLGKLQLLSRKQEEIEVDMLIVQAKPVRDDPDHLPVCYRCSSTNPLLNPFTSKIAKGDVCTNCGHPFVRSFINFDILPLVEFIPDEKISDEEAIDLIRQPPPDRSRFGRGGRGGGWKEGKDGGADTMTFDGGDDGRYDDDYNSYGRGGGGGGGEEGDLFTSCLNATLERQRNAQYLAVKVNADTLLSLKRSEVFVCRPSSKNKRATFYRNMLPDISVAISQPCHRFFHLEDFEFAYLSNQSCPYSKLKNVGEYGSL